MKGRIRELELNFSNICTAECIFCSRPHGVGGSPFMTPDTFAVLLSQLKEIDIDIIQTSGNGETFLNSDYLDYIRALKRELPDTPRWIYNNFSLMTPERADAIVSEQLFDRVCTRIDSLQKWIHERNSNLNFERVMENIDYFLSVNDSIPMTLLYNDINLYYRRCLATVGKRPVRDYYTDDELACVPDEYEAIKEHFTPKMKCEHVISRISPCLWGERGQAPLDIEAPCPKINVIKQVIWVLPSGDVTACCYDDRQDAFIVGNIHEEHLYDIFNGDKRREFIAGIEQRKYTDYPCRSPKCCGFGGGIEAK